MQRSNSAEGGSNGVTVTQAVGGNTGGASGDYFDTVLVNGALIFDNTHARDTLSYKIAPSSSNADYLEWNTQMGTVSTVYGRFYIWLDTSPNSTPIIHFRSGATSCARLVINPSGANGTMNWKDGAGVDIAATTTSALTPSQWYRFEYKVIFSTTVGQVVYSYYLGDSTSAIQTLTSAASVNFGAASADSMRIGRVFTGIANTYIIWLDNIVVNDTGFPGPATLERTYGANVGELFTNSAATSFGTGE